MRIVLDAMGGDNAPKAEVKGAISAVKSFKDITVILVGIKQEIEKRFIQIIKNYEKIYKKKIILQ